MSLFLLAGLIFLAWFAVGCTAVVFLYACALHVQARKQRAIERMSRCPDQIPAEWEPSWLAVKSLIGGPTHDDSRRAA